MKIRKLDSKADLVIDDIKKFSIIRVSPLLPVPFGDDDLDREAYDLSNSDISLTRGQLVFLVYTRNSIDLKLVFSELHKAGFQVRDISPNDPDESWPPRITSEKLLSYSSQELWRCIPCVGCMKLKIVVNTRDFKKFIGVISSLRQIGLRNIWRYPWSSVDHPCSQFPRSIIM